MTIQEYIIDTFKLVENYVLNKDFGPYISVEQAYSECLESGLIKKFQYEHPSDIIEYEFAKIGISNYHKFITDKDM